MPKMRGKSGKEGEMGGKDGEGTWLAFVKRRGGPSALNMPHTRNPAVASSTPVRLHFLYPITLKYSPSSKDTPTCSRTSRILDFEQPRGSISSHSMEQ